MAKKTELAKSSEELKAKYGRKVYRGYDSGKLITLNYLYQAMKLSEGRALEKGSLFTKRQKEAMEAALTDKKLLAEDEDKYWDINLRYNGYNVMLDWTETHARLANRDANVIRQSLKALKMIQMYMQMTLEALRRGEVQDAGMTLENMVKSYSNSVFYIEKAYAEMCRINAAFEIVGSEIAIPEYTAEMTEDTTEIEEASEDVNAKAVEIIDSVEDWPEIRKTLEAMTPIELVNPVTDYIRMQCEVAMRDLRIFCIDRGASLYDNFLEGFFSHGR